MSAAVQLRPCSLAAGPWRFDYHDHTFGHAETDRRVELSRTEFKLLELLMRHAGKPVSRQWILENVWSSKDARIETNVVDVYVSYLRNKIGEALIATVRGQGYRFNAEARA